MKRYQQEAVEVEIRPAEGEYLKVRTQSCGDQPAVITVGRGADWSPLACKDVYGRAVKEANAWMSVVPLLRERPTRSAAGRRLPFNLAAFIKWIGNDIDFPSLNNWRGR